MKEILIAISTLSISYGEVEFPSAVQIQNNWLGYDPAILEQIADAEKRLNIKLPSDYKEFLLITDGFTAPTTINPSFMSIDNVDYLINIDPYVVEVWSENEELREVTEALKKSIIIGGKDEEQYFLLIPPSKEAGAWRYWTFSSWAPGEQQFNNLEAYFNNVLEFIKDHN